MLKDILIEVALLLAVFASIFFSIPFLVSYSSPFQAIGLLSLFAFIGVIVKSGFHIQKLWDHRKMKHAITFSATLATFVVVSSIVVWVLFGPRSL